MTHKQIVVIGGGIVGASTVYYLTRHPALAEAAVYLFEGTEIAAGASGKAGGFLASDWHGPATASLAALSYRLHTELAAEHDGVNRWGYRPVTALSLTADVTGASRKNPCKGASHLKEDALGWLDAKIISSASVLGTPETVAQTHPRLLTQALVEEAQKAGAKVHIASVEKLERGEDGRPVAVIGRTRDGEEVKVDATDVVIAAGPWSGKLAQTLLEAKEAKKVHVTGSRAHSIVVRPPEGKQLTAHVLFTDIKQKGGSVEPEMYCRPDGTAYICGPTDSSHLPPSPGDVTAVPSAIARLKEQAALLSPSHFPLTADSIVEAEQACYLPIGTSWGGSSPIIGKVAEGVYVASRHAVWGIAHGPGTGKVVAEMILEGEAKSADVSMLAP